MIAKLAGYATGISAIVGALWAALVLAGDERYVQEEELSEIVQQLREDRIQADLRDVEADLAIIVVQEGYADGEWKARRREERQVLEQKRDSLERELSRIR